jgi:hypothetical protein
LGSTFTAWEGCTVLTKTELESTCEVTLSTAKAVGAMFTAAVKSLVNPKTLTLTKEGSGYGTIKTAGLACEALCTSTTVAYFGGVTEPRAKAATIVTLTATPLAGSQLTEWVNCPTSEGLVCKASMSEAHTVTATFEE